jgi:tRNA modification GTPase
VAPGQGSVAIVRLSGPQAEVIGRTLFAAPGRQQWGSHRVLYGHVLDPASGERVDEALLLLMKAPRSFTREDVVELHCHGGLEAVRRVLELVLAAGARRAGPGEFSQRAFLNGRLDLTQELEARVDFEEDLPPLDAAAVVAELVAVRAELEQLVAEARQGELLREGLRVAIVGRPNVGKSSLLNLLSRRDRAIVTDLPGTTRDLLESELVLDGVPLTLLDTAGIRATDDPVERLGIERSRAALASADGVLLLFDLAAGWTAEDQALRDLVPEGVPLLLVGNKADLLAGAAAPVTADVCISALSGAGREPLAALLLQRCGAGEAQGLQVALNGRQRDLAADAAASLAASLEAADQALPWDFWTIDLRAAVRRLGEITGEEVSEAVLDRVFARFCIGK